ncbi:MAG: hypothetical protein WC783_03435 [Candidatus Paceibacterota bacterium]|jgi:hypothetical protein
MNDKEMNDVAKEIFGDNSKNVPLENSIPFGEIKNSEDLKNALDKAGIGYDEAQQMADLFTKIVSGLVVAIGIDKENDWTKINAKALIENLLGFGNPLRLVLSSLMMAASPKNFYVDTLSKIYKECSNGK